MWCVSFRYCQQILHNQASNKGKQISAHVRRLRLPGFKTVGTWVKVVRLSDLDTGCLYPQEIFPVLVSVKRLSRTQGHSAAGRIMSKKNSNDTIGNRNLDLPACSVVPQPTNCTTAYPSLQLFFLSPSIIAICPRTFCNRVWRSLLMACRKYIQWCISYINLSHIDWVWFLIHEVF